MAFGMYFICYANKTSGIIFHDVMALSLKKIGGAFCFWFVRPSIHTRWLLVGYAYQRRILMLESLSVQRYVRQEE